ncbi:MAG: membrane protein insertion efficiency factor YidD [Parachlamydiaceae bacterium]|nr:membrane protein insertion efficiency factor YidD [Parachlamydiaceae bacterium]
MKWILIFFVKIYQLTISPFLGTCCRFNPSCSQYMIESLKKHGTIKGTLLGVKRLSKCHPFHSGGNDPLP